MPARRPPGTTPPRALRARRPVLPLALPLALPVVLALALTGCGAGSGKEEPKASADRPSTSAASPAARSSEDAPAPDPGFGAPRVGQCFRLTPRESRSSVATSRHVGCRGTHTSVVARVAFLDRPVTAGTPLARRQALGRRTCEPAFRRTVGGTEADRATSILTWTLFTPGRAQLERGARWVRCDVLARTGDGLVPLPPATPLLGRGVPEPLRTCQDAGGADISCAGPHAYRVEAVYRVVGGYPDPGSYTATARARCLQLMHRPGGFWQPPSRSGWAAGDRFVRCLAPSP